MKFNWILATQADDALKKFCIDLEYQLRPKITKFLMSRLEAECHGDFSSFSFDVDIATQQITISDKTPSKYAHRIASDFDLEINRNLVILPAI